MPEGYTRVSDASLQVTVTDYGLPSPTTARFIYRKPETPTPPAVETPPPPAVPGGILSPGGSTITWNGVSATAPWYVNDNGAAYLALERLAELAGAQPSREGDLTTWQINGHAVSVRSAEGAAVGLAIDGQDRSSSGFVMNGGMYVEQMLLNELGVDMRVEGDALTLTVR